MRNILIAFIVTMFLACSSHASTSTQAPVVASDQKEDPFFLVREDFCETDGQINQSTDICPIVTCPANAPVEMRLFLRRQERVDLDLPTRGTIFVCIGPFT